MLRDVETAQPLSQGDIIADVPFFIIPKVITFKLHGEKGQHQGTPTNPTSFRMIQEQANTAKKGILATELVTKIEYGIVISQSCDIDNKDYITIARITPLGELVSQARDALELDEPYILFDIKKRLTEGTDYAHLLYLGQIADDSLMCGDLLRNQTFPKRDWRECFCANRVKSLTDQGLKYLQGRLAAFTGRYATDAGFWQTEADKKCASEVAADKTLIKKAYDSLEAKKNARRSGSGTAPQA